VTVDVAIRGGTVVDGTGTSAVEADVGLVGDRIAVVGDLAREPAGTTLDASGCFVAPGFIDMHSHVEESILLGESLEPKLRQGVTLEVLGQDGVGLAPIPDDARSAVEETFTAWSGATALDWRWESVSDLLHRMDGSENNVVYLVPHGNLRIAVAGLEDRPMTSSEMDHARALLGRALDDGAAGFSTGLTYLPCMFADTAELIALCEIAARRRRYFSPHHRGYGVTAMRSYEECAEICAASGVAVHLTHAVLEYPVNAGRARDLLAIVDREAAAGRSMTLDSYPYTAGVSSLASFLPAWTQEGGAHATLQRIREPALQIRIRNDVAAGRIPVGTPVDWDALVVSSVVDRRFEQHVGSSIREIAASAGRDPFSCFIELLDANDLSVQVLEFAADEENVRTILRHPAHMVCSDGALRDGRPHPRAWGAFARFLGRYVRELGSVGWEEAVRKMTSLPASTIGVRDRGRIAEGLYADIVVFEPDTVSDTATYDQPMSPAVGMRHVMVNGEPAIIDERYVPRKAGRALAIA
jgi:N-acyl-D-amino-acid deacylase